ncbi:hypothetical protein T4E_6428 [Trichinella pseudospiralis]|uniref:Uncharacterized protein n=1 Tax=Trichinella pseudospiralis TaxID=6337 RepID=A0A0V0YBM9_TRIPS|nr:hypothetical protein T4E_6428 [Trichinella pseudospiralis]
MCACCKDTGKGISMKLNFFRLQQINADFSAFVVLSRFKSAEENKLCWATRSTVRQNGNSHGHMRKMSAEPDVIKAGNTRSVSDETSTKSTVTNVDQRLLNDAWYLITADFVADKVHSTLFMHKTKQRCFYEALEKYERNLNFDKFIERVFHIFNTPPALNSPLPSLLLLFMKPKDLLKSKFQSQYWQVKKALDLYKSMIFSTQNRGQRLKLKNFFRNSTQKPLDVYFSELLNNIDKIGSWHEILKTLCPDVQYIPKDDDQFEKAVFVQDESGEPVVDDFETVYLTADDGDISIKGNSTCSSCSKGEPCLWRKFRQGENGQLLYRVDGIELPMDVEYYDEITVSEPRSANSQKKKVSKHGGMESNESTQNQTADSGIHESVDTAALEACLPERYFEWAARINRQIVSRTTTNKSCHDEVLKPEQVQKNPDDISDSEFMHKEMKQQKISDSVDSVEGSFFGRITQDDIVQYVNMGAGPSNLVLLEGNNSNDHFIESVDQIPVTSFSGVAVYSKDNINAVYSQSFAFAHASDIIDFPKHPLDSLEPVELSDIEITTDFTFDNYLNDQNLTLESVIAQTAFLADHDVPTCSGNLLTPSIMFNEPTTTQEADRLAESHYMPSDFTETSPVDISLGNNETFSAVESNVVEPQCYDQPVNDDLMLQEFIVIQDGHSDYEMAEQLPAEDVQQMMNLNLPDDLQTLSNVESDPLHTLTCADPVGDDFAYSLTINDDFLIPFEIPHASNLSDVPICDPMADNYFALPTGPSVSSAFPVDDDNFDLFVMSYTLTEMRLLLGSVLIVCILSSPLGRWVM